MEKCFIRESRSMKLPKRDREGTPDAKELHASQPSYFQVLHIEYVESFALAQVSHRICIGGT